jgi:hypothetical protein
LAHSFVRYINLYHLPNHSSFVLYTVLYYSLVHARRSVVPPSSA